MLKLPLTSLYNLLLRLDDFISSLDVFFTSSRDLGIFVSPKVISKLETIILSYLQGLAAENSDVLGGISSFALDSTVGGPAAYASIPAPRTTVVDFRQFTLLC